MVCSDSYILPWKCHKALKGEAEHRYLTSVFSFSRTLSLSLSFYLDILRKELPVLLRLLSKNYGMTARWRKMTARWRTTFRNERKMKNHRHSLSTICCWCLLSQMPKEAQWNSREANANGPMCEWENLFCGEDFRYRSVSTIRTVILCVKIVPAFPSFFSFAF